MIRANFEPKLEKCVKNEDQQIIDADKFNWFLLAIFSGHYALNEYLHH